MKYSKGRIAIYVLIMALFLGSACTAATSEEILADLQAFESDVSDENELAVEVGWVEEEIGEVNVNQIELSVEDSMTSGMDESDFQSSPASNVVTRDGFTVVDGVLTAWEQDPTVQVLVIPDNMGITSIGRGCFMGMKGLETVILPDAVKSIVDYAFCNCTGLQQIALSKSLTTISQCAFAGCNGLQSITIPRKVVSIGFAAFENCTGLRKVIIKGKKLKEVGGSAFNGCSSLRSMKLPDSVRSIGQTAFYETTAMTQIDVGKGLTSIGYEAFYKSGIKAITIPGTLKHLDCSEFWSRGIFVMCPNLVKVELQKGVETIGDYAFNNCEALVQVAIPSTVTNIEGYAFSGCRSLNKLTIKGNGLRTIGNGAFRGCSALNVVKLPKSVTSIGSYAFSGTGNLTSVNLEKNLTKIGACSFENSGLRSIIIPGTIKNIEGSAFYNCSSLTKVTISDGVTGIDSSAFRNCRSIKAIVIPNSVTTISRYAFAGCSSLKTIVLPKSVTSIDDTILLDCNSLKKVYVYADSFALDFCMRKGLPYTILKEIPVRQIKLNKEKLALKVGDTVTLTATIKPVNATDKGLIWNTNNPSVVTVENGRVTAVGKGSAVITCYAHGDVNKKAKCIVKVKGK